MLKSFKEKHASYFSILWSTSVIIGVIYGFYDWFRLLIEAIAAKSILLIIFSMFWQTIIVGITTMIVALSVFVFLSVICFIPYVIIRGIMN